MSVKDRMIFYLEKKGISPTKAESDLGWSKGALLKAKSVSSDRLEEFVLLYNDISPKWLLTGEGEMIKSDSKMDSVLNDNPVESPEEVVMLKTIISNQNDYIEKLKKENQELREQLNIKERQVG